MINDECKGMANAIAEQTDSDVLLYNGPIERGLDRQVIDLCARNRRRSNVLLLLVTEGGNPDAAFRISRMLQSYKKFSCFVSGYCKSAGTLIATGANELIFSRHGELGPLDTQMTKEDELWESQSGLTVTASLSTLNDKAFLAFEDFFLKTKFDLRGAITLRTAADVAARLATGLFAPIYQQFDPMHIGEAGRSIAIANQYGVRLALHGRNLKPESLERLISGYASHGFVIDMEEAERLFVNVREANDNEQRLQEMLCDVACVPLDAKQLPSIEFLSNQEEGKDATPVDVHRPGEEHGANPNPPETGGGASGN